MSKRPKRKHTLVWYQREYGLPLQTVINAHRRGWPLDDPLKLLRKFMDAPGPKTAGLQPLIDYVNGQPGASPVAPGPSQSAPKRQNEAEQPDEPRAQDEAPDALVRIEMQIGPLVFTQMITPAEAEQVCQLNERSWQNLTTE